MGRSDNRSGGPEDASATRMKHKAGSHARGTKQKKGDSGSGKGAPQKSKFQKRDSSGKESLDEMQF